MKRKHFKEHKELTDYITVIDHSLNNEAIKLLKNVELDKGYTLGEHLEALVLYDKHLQEKVFELQDEVGKLKEAIELILGGLNLRWRKNYLHYSHMLT